MKPTAVAIIILIIIAVVIAYLVWRVFQLYGELEEAMRLARHFEKKYREARQEALDWRCALENLTETVLEKGRDK